MAKSTSMLLILPFRRLLSIKRHVPSLELIVGCADKSIILTYEEPSACVFNWPSDNLYDLWLILYLAYEQTNISQA